MDASCLSIILSRSIAYDVGEGEGGEDERPGMNGRVEEQHLN